MKLTVLSEASVKDAMRVGLDVAGLVPGIGETADFANAMMYLKDGEYLFASLSFISMVPEIGDIIGKGIKYIIKSKKLGAKFLSQHASKIDQAWRKVVPVLEKIRKVRPSIRKMQEAIDELLKDVKSQELVNK